MQKLFLNRFFTQCVYMAVAFSACVFEPRVSFAQSPRRPAGLNPGDEYRLVFVTEGVRDAESPRIADYNDFVTAEAHSPTSIVRDLPAEWFAIASTRRTDAIENTSTDPSPPGDTGVPIYLVDGSSLFAAHYDRMWDGDSSGYEYLGFFSMKQDGETFADFRSIRVWTGTNYYGVASSRPLGTVYPSQGRAVGFNGRWIQNGAADESDPYHYYAISSVLVAVPEPSTVVLLGVSLVLCGAHRAR